MRKAFVAVLAVGLASCTRADKGPVLTSSAGQPSYALGYADELDGSWRAMGEGQDQERRLTAGFAARVDELKKPDWDVVRAVVDASDAAGSSAGFAGAHGRVDSVREFWGDEKTSVDAKVAGGAQYALKQASCASGCPSLDVGGPAAYALNEALDHDLQKRLRASNDAFLIIERQRTALGPANAAALEKLADDVAQASFVVHVALVVERDRLRKLLADKGSVLTTLDRFVQDERTYQVQPGRSDADKKASDQRVNDATKSKSQIAAAAAQADAASSGADQVIAGVTKDYDDALKALRDRIDMKKKAG